MQKLAHSCVEKRLVEYAEMEYLISAQGLIVMFVCSVQALQGLIQKTPRYTHVIN